MDSLDRAPYGTRDDPASVRDRSVDRTVDHAPDPSFVPFTPVRPPSPAGPSTATVVGEPIAPPSRTATSSRPFRGRWLAGVLAVSMLSAVVGSIGTVGLLNGLGTTEQGAGTAAVSTASSGASAAPVIASSADRVVAVAESASPAVVTIRVGSAGRSGFGPSGPSTGVGSGFVFDAAGLILTNAHVVEGSDQITVTFHDGSELAGSVVASDPQLDLAVVRVDPPAALPTIPIGDASALKVGQQVIAIGSPLGTFTESVTAGILSATGRTIEVGSPNSRRTTTMSGLLQTDASINPGNSGGPLLDDTGAVIGVNSAAAQSAQGIGFAVPIDVAADIMSEARATVGIA